MEWMWIKRYLAQGAATIECNEKLAPRILDNQSHHKLMAIKMAK